jgi:RNA polymerase sigma factor (sigma-70 family)
MDIGRPGTILRHLHDLLDSATAQGLSDAQLLGRYAEHRDETAFATLVARHARLVWGVCRHRLHRDEDAEDAFQATFFILARRAGSIRKAEAVGSWLHGVAHRVAMKAKKSARRRQIRERQATRTASSPPPSDLSWRELQAALDEEVQRLPERYRAPFVLCCLEGRSREEAAQEIGCLVGTVSSRIARARRLLQGRLARRGVTLSAALCAGELWGGTSAAVVPNGLMQSAAKTCSTAGTSKTAVALAEGALRTMGLVKWQVGVALFLAFGLLTAAAGIGSDSPKARPDGPKEKAAADRATATGKDRFGDPLPPGALARFGTLRQRAADADVAVTADGKEIVTVGLGRTVRRFDAATGELRSVRQLPVDPAFLIKLSPRGTYALTFALGGAHEIELWDLARMQRLRSAPVGDYHPWGMRFSTDEGRVAVADSNMATDRVLVWELKEERPRVLWSAPQQRSPDGYYFEPFMTLSPDGKRLLVCYLDQKLRCWDVESSKLLWDPGWRNYHTPYMFFNHDGSAIISPRYTGMAGLDFRDAATGRLLDAPKQPPNDAVRPIGTSPDGRFLVFESDSDQLVLWKPGSDKAAFRLPRPKDLPYLNRYSVPSDFAFTPDGQSIIRRCGTLQRLDLTNGKTTFPDTEDWGHTGGITRLVFSPDGRSLASSATDHTVRVWNVATGRTRFMFARGLSDYLAFTSDGRSVLAAPEGLEKVLQRRDAATGREREGFKLPSPDSLGHGQSSEGKEIRVTADGRKVLVLTTGILMAWDAASGACVIPKQVPWWDDCVITPDGKGVVAVGGLGQLIDGSLQLLDIDTATPRVSFDLGQQRTRLGVCAAHNLVLSSDGHWLASSVDLWDEDSQQVEAGGLRLWDVATGRLVLEVPTGPCVLGFSPDCHLFAAANRDGVRLWETIGWQEVGSIPAHNRDAVARGSAFATALALSPNGRTLATGHADSTILLWDATLRNGARGGPLTSAAAANLWADLAGADARRAHAALWRLADDPARAIPQLKEQLQPITPSPPERTRSLLDGLDSNQFKVREAAERELRALGERAVPALRAALKANPSAEKKRHIKTLLSALERTATPSSHALRELRAVQVLEHIGSPEAKALLQELAGGVDGARLTVAAKEALGRLRDE